MSFSKKSFEDLIKVALDHKASDIHIRTDEVPCFRIKGEIIPIKTKVFSDSDVHSILEILTEEKDIDVDKFNELDGGLELSGICRVRYNIFKYDRKYGAVLRLINSKIPSLEDLGLPSILKKISLQKRGLILVTGPTGSGKSTTLAAMIDYINQKRKAHVLTIEDPIEYLHEQKKSRISQREVMTDTNDFITALRSALRQDPDIILIGEMRDPETVSIALKAAETGHLVLSTMHTTNSVTTIGRILSLFKPEEQEAVRERLAENLYACIGQRLLKGKEKPVLAQEIMITGPGIKDCIKGDDDIHRIFKIVADGFGQEDIATQTFDQCVGRLYEKGIISKEVAVSAVSSETDFLRSLELT